jgi:ketosteroid isomerase-like protein
LTGVDRRRREELVRAAFETWNSGAMDVDRFAHPEGVVHSAVTNETYEGYEGIERWRSEIDEQFSRWELRVDEFRDLAPDGLVAIGSISMRGRASGVELEQPIVWLFRFRDELVFEMTVYADVEQGLAAAERAGGDQPNGGA